MAPRHGPAIPAAVARTLAVEALLALALGLAWFAVSSLVQERWLPTRLGATLPVLAVDAVVVLLVARRLSILYAVPVGVASVVAVDWFLIPPTHSTLLPNPENAVALSAYLVTGTFLGCLAALVVRRAAVSEAARSALAEEHAALRRVATLVARQTPPDEVFAAVCHEARELLSVEVVSLVRYEPDGTATVAASASASDPPIPVGTSMGIEGDNVSRLVRSSGRPARIDDQSQSVGAVAERMREHGVRASVGSPVTVNDRLWGVMVAASTSEVPFPEETETRLAELTGLVATAISNADNQHELQASRARVVASGDETRRRLERDLHDGVQRLVSLALNLRVARTVADADPVAAATGLGGVQDELAGVVEDLRELSRGLHPAILSAGGLSSALGTLARRTPLPVELDVDGRLDLPEQVEVGLYYVVAEALTNIVKHAEATFAEIAVRRADGVVSVRVADDGVGGASTGHGSGLVGLADRVAALDGRLSWSSPVGVGTVIEAVVPVPDVVELTSPQPD